MEDLAPKIYRQRLIIEGIYSCKITSHKLASYLKELSNELGMTLVYGPIVKNLAEKINPIHKGFEGFLIWAESGVSIYTWKNEKFLTVDIYTCKKFSQKTAINFTKKFFKMPKIVSKSV